MISWPYTFTALAGDRVAAGEVGLDALAVPGAVSRVYFANLTADGLDARRAIAAHPIGTMIVLQHRANADAFITLVTTAAAIEQKSHVEIRCACTDASTPTLAAGPIEAFFLPVVVRAAAMALTASTDPPLVSLADAKEHLRIKDNDHDADVLQKMTSASASIRDYLKDRNDPAWTPDTAPGWVTASVLLLLAHQYEHRGDAFGAAGDRANDNDDRVWSAIANLLRRSRDPALA